MLAVKTFLSGAPLSMFKELPASSFRFCNAVSKLVSGMYVYLSQAVVLKVMPLSKAFHPSAWFSVILASTCTHER